MIMVTIIHIITIIITTIITTIMTAIMTATITIHQETGATEKPEQHVLQAVLHRMIMTDMTTAAIAITVIMILIQTVPTVRAADTTDKYIYIIKTLTCKLLAVRVFLCVYKELSVFAAIVICPCSCRILVLCLFNATSGLWIL